MNKITILGLIILFAIVFVGVYAYKGMLPQLIQSVSNMVQPVINWVQSTFTQIKTTWATIPETMRGVILLGIPTAFATFFAWTKSRAMQKLQQTQVEAKAQFNQMSGEASDQALQIEAQKLEIERLKTLNPNEQITQLTADLNKTEEVLHSKRIELEGKDRTIDTLESQLVKLRKQLAEAEAKLIPIK